MNEMKTIPSMICRSLDEVDEIIKKLGFPVILRPSYIIGGRGMVIAHTKEELVEGLISLWDKENSGKVGYAFG